MTDYGEQGATPVDDAAVDDPPTVDEVMEAQRREHPEQAATSTLAEPANASTGESERVNALDDGAATVEEDDSATHDAER